MSTGYGVMASFASPGGFAAAVRAAREAGYTRWETYLPFAIEGAAELSPARPSPVPKAMAIGGVLSGLTAFFLQYYAAHDYALNVGGRPLNSWPSFVPITFELTVLGSALTGVFTLLWLAGFPRLDHPVFNDARFSRASRDRFFLCIRSDDPLYAPAKTERFLTDLGAESVAEVPL
jgi:hypothetical protein